MFCAHFIVFILFFLERAFSTNYIILIDAGSTGSRVHVHSYDGGPGTIPVIAPSNNLKVKPGLSSYERMPEQAGISLIPLLDYAKTIIPKDLWKKTPIYLQATAGLRSIPPAAAEEVLQYCRKTIQSYPFFFKPSFAVIISGQQEGINGWIAANYLNGVFHEKNPKTIGVIEMGGASMQMTFALKDVPNGLCGQQELIDLRISNHNFRLYTHSYLDYGLEMVQMLFERRHGEIIQKEGNPCYPTAIKTRVGAGNYARCSALIGELLSKDNCSCQCSFNGVFQPAFAEEFFYAIENFFYTSKFFGLETMKDFALQLPIRGEAYCSTHWDELLKKYPNENPADLEKYCFSAAYIPKMLSHGLGFQENQLQAFVEPARLIKGTSIDWALGAVFLSILHGGAVDTKLIDGALRVTTTDPELQLFDSSPSVAHYSLILLLSFILCASLMFYLSRSRFLAQYFAFWKLKQFDFLSKRIILPL